MNGGRTFPSLVVVARPNLRNKDISPQVAQKERAELGTYLHQLSYLIYRSMYY